MTETREAYLDRVRLESERDAWERRAHELEEELGRARNKINMADDDRNKAWRVVREQADRIRDLEERLTLIDIAIGSGKDGVPQVEPMQRLNAALALVESVPDEALPDTKVIYGPRMWLSDAKRSLEAAIRQTREWEARPKETKKGKRHA